MGKFLSALRGAAPIRMTAPPQAVVDIVCAAAREMGAETSGTGDGSRRDGITLAVHGKENGVVWVVQVDIRRAWKGSSVELTALGEGMGCPDIYEASVKRRDALADALRG